MHAQAFVLSLWAILWLVSPSVAQTSRIFKWSFSAEIDSAQLPTCDPLPIAIETFNSTTTGRGTPPYYMVAYAVGGTPITTLIGTGVTGLSWRPMHPVDTKLVLSVVDANGSSGGTGAQVYTVVTGQTTQCVAVDSGPPFSVTTNVTTELHTCQPWGFTINGGVSPYTLSLLATDSPVVTNITLGRGDDYITYINRALPGSRLLGAISDSTGRWASGATLVDTRGSSDVLCDGLDGSVSGKATDLKPPSASSTAGSSQTSAAQPSASQAASDSKKNSIIIGISVTLGVLILIGLAFGILFFIRKRRRRTATADSADIKPRQFMIEPSNPVAYPNSSQFEPTTTSTFSSGSPVGLDGVSGTLPLSSEGQSSKARRILQSTTDTSTIAQSHSEHSASAGDTVIQHTDASLVSPQELPPPYLDQRA